MTASDLRLAFDSHIQNLTAMNCMINNGHRVIYPCQWDVHCFGEFSGLHIPNIKFYVDRALLMPSGRVLVQISDHHERDLIEKYHRYLNKLGFGPNRVIVVKSEKDGLLNGLLEPSQKSIIDFLRHELENNYCHLRVFSSGGDYRKFIKHLDVHSAALLSTVGTVVEELDNKRNLRELAERIGLEGLFPSYHLATTESDFRTLLEQARNEWTTVFVKRADLEGGDGQLCVRPETSNEQIDAFVSSFVTGHHPIILDQGIVADNRWPEALDASLQWFVRLDKNLSPLFFSEQCVEGSSHMGNHVTQVDWWVLPHSWGDNLRKRIVADAWEKTRVLTEYALERGYVGNLGFDLRIRVSLERQEFEVYILEANARVTAGTYAHAVMAQATEALTVSNVSMRMVKLPEGRYSNWEAVLVKLAEYGLDYNPDRARGIILAVPRMVPYGKICLLSVSTSTEWVRYDLDTAIEILGS